MTILEIEKGAAALLSDAGAPITTSDFTVSGFDVALMLLNQIRQSAEMGHDFNFQRQLLTLSVDTVTGASLDDVVIQGTMTPAEIKTIVEVGMFDTYGNFRPVEWTTVEEGQERTRQENPFWGIRYPTDGQAVSWPLGQRRYVIRNNTIALWPTTQMPAQTIPLGIEAYVFSADWTDTATTDIWTERASQYLLWQLVVNLNLRFKFFVPRTEGNLPPPQALADQGLETFKQWDIFKYEGFRRHGR